MADLGLDDLQVEVLHLFFSLPESDGFVLAGGAALVAAGLSRRPTRDLDLFTSSASVTGAGDALESAAGDRGWGTERIQESPTFAGWSSSTAMAPRCSSTSRWTRRH